MSRIEIRHPGKALAFGEDHARGEYLQIWDTSEYSEPDCDNVLVDEDKMTGLTRQRMLELIEQHGFTFDELEKAHRGEP